MHTDPCVSFYNVVVKRGALPLRSASGTKEVTMYEELKEVLNTLIEIRRGIRYTEEERDIYEPIVEQLTFAEDDIRGAIALL